MDAMPKIEDEASSSTAKCSTRNSDSLLCLQKCSCVPRDPCLFCYSNMEPFSNEDIAIEVLSRLPARSLLAFKCTARKWNKLISDPSFLRFLYKTSFDIVGLFVQEVLTCRESAWPLGPVHFYSLGQNKCRLNLDFLPEKVILVGSSNGIICCRTYSGLGSLTNDEFIPKNPVDLVIYLCDPIRKEWVTLRLPLGLRFNDVIVFGLASYPFGTSSNKAPSFKLVSLQNSRNGRNVHSFFMYSSDTGIWEESRGAVCTFGYLIREDMAMFVNGWLHWSTLDHHLLSFDVENESSKLIKLPCSESGENQRVRFGESEGYLHYVCVLNRELQVWVLKDFVDPVWELKYHLDVLEFCLMNSSLFETPTLEVLKNNYFGEPAEDANDFVVAWSYYNDVLVLAVVDVVLSYDLKTRRVIQHTGRFKNPRWEGVCPAVVIQFHANLVSLGNFVRDDCVESCSKQARWGGILPCKRRCES